MSDDPDYKVGYKKPPLETRFQKGRSANPGGRPKGSRNISSVIAAALNERVVITENGRRRSITKLEAAAKQLANRAAGGDKGAAKLILDLLHQSETRDLARTAGELTTPADRKANDAAILAAIRDRALGVAREDDDGAQS